MASEANATGNLRQRNPVEAMDDDDAVGSGLGLPGDTIEAARLREEKELMKASSRWSDFLRSRRYKMFVFAIVAVTPVLGVLVAMPVLLDKLDCVQWSCRVRHFLLATWLSLQFMYNFSMTQWTDPGGTRNITPTLEAQGQFELNLGPALPVAGASPPSASVDTVYHAPNYCHRCRQWKPPRTHHCSFCGRCVLRMDHHCPFTGNCIGMRNHGHLLLMYLFAKLGLAHCLCLCVAVLSQVPRPESAWPAPSKFANAGPTLLPDHLLKEPFAHRVFVVVAHALYSAGFTVALQTTLSSLALLAVLSCGLPAASLAFRGITVIEFSFPMKDYVAIQPNVYRPLGPGFYQKRWHENMRELLGPTWWWRLLLPTRGVADLTPAIAPLPGERGTRDLRMRIDEALQGKAWSVPGV